MTLHNDTQGYGGLFKLGASSGEAKLSYFSEHPQERASLSAAGLLPATLQGD